MKEIAADAFLANNHLIPSFCFLEQHHLGGAWYTNALLEQLGIKRLWNLASNVSGNIADEGLPADACTGGTHSGLQVHLKGPHVTSAGARP